ncbi:MAG: hypothetical protein V3V08_23370 [Nannocystaceae bacterium]
MTEESLVEWIKAIDFDSLHHPDWDFAKRAFAPGVTWDGECYVHKTSGSVTQMSPSYIESFLRGLVTLHGRPEEIFPSPDEVG